MNPSLDLASVWRCLIDAICAAARERGQSPVVLSSLPAPSSLRAGATLPLSFIEAPPGRAIALATGLRAALPDAPLAVVMNADSVTLGTNHLIHAVRRNIDVMVLLLRAELTAHEGDAPARLHWGVPSYQRALETVPKPLDWASALEAAFVGRGCVHDGAQLARVLGAALNTRGLSVVGITGDSRLATGTLSRNAWPEHFAAYRAWAATLPAVPALAAHVIDPAAHPVDRWEVRLAGIGGQGIKLAGTVLAEAAGLHAGLFATERGDYGSATRGGQSAVDVVIGSDPITYAGADHADVLVLLSQPAADRYGHCAKTGAFVFADTTNVHAPPAGAIPIPIADLAREHTGKVIAAGVVSLGCVAAVTNAISMRALELAIRGQVPTGVVAANLAACMAGYAATRSLLEGATA